MLSNVLGIAIAFVTVILLLSMVVTGLVQATQAVLRLRSRNLQQGIAALLRKYSDDTLSRPESRRKAAGVLNSDLATVGRVLKGDSPLHRILGPKVSWADPADIAAAVTSLASDAAAVPAANAPAAAASEAVATAPDSATVESARRREKAWLTEEVKRMEPAMSKRFLLFIRLWTIFWSLVIATLFQVSTPELLSSFTSGTRSTAPAGKGAAEAEETARRAGLEVGSSDANKQAQTEALNELKKKYPNYADQLAQANVGGARQTAIDAVASAVKAAPEREAITRDYSVLLDEGTRARQQSVAAAGESAEEQLKAYGIRFWGDKRYYVNDKGHLRWEAIVGVLMTGILMSFGAPFWFNQLRYLASLRDVKAPLPTPDK